MFQRPLRTSLFAGILVFIVIAVYGVLRPPVWEATQPLMIRAEALEGSRLPGRFESDQQRRQALDALVAVFQSCGVLEATLREVGPPRSIADRSYPGLTDVERLQRSVRVVPPSDTDFGTTDLIYLKVRDSQPDRAVRLASALVRHADRQLREIQSAKAEATVKELVLAEKNATETLQTLQRQLQEIEAQLGLDGLTLRSYEAKLDESPLRAAISDLEDQLEDLETQIATEKELIRLLREAEAKPETLSSIPPALLQKYPTLGRFKEALTDAEVKLIELRGQYADEHPTVVAAQLALDDLKDRIREEIPTIIQTIQNEQGMELVQKRLLDEKLRSEEAKTQAILSLLPQYHEVMARVRSQGEAVRDAQQRLATARALAATARSTQLITPLENPQTGNQPVGPGKLMFIAGGMVSGLFLALCLFLWLSPAVPGGNSQEFSHTAISNERVLLNERMSDQILVAQDPGRPLGGTFPGQMVAQASSVDSSTSLSEMTSGNAPEQLPVPNNDNQERAKPASLPTTWPDIPVDPDWASSPLHQALASATRSWESEATK